MPAPVSSSPGKREEPESKTYVYAATAPEPAKQEYQDLDPDLIHPERKPVPAPVSSSPGKREEPESKTYVYAATAPEPAKQEYQDLDPDLIPPSANRCRRP